MIGYFRMLPTDPRFRELSEEQKWVIFEMVNANFSEDEIRKLYREHQKREQMKVKDDSVKQAMEAAGIDPEVVNRAIEDAEIMLTGV